MTRILIDDSNLSPDEDFVWMDVLKRGESRLSICVRMTKEAGAETVVCEAYKEPRTDDSVPVSSMSIPIEEK